MRVEFRCKNCQGTRVQLMAWVDANTEECVELVGDLVEGSGENWCEDCDASAGLERVNICE